MLIQNEYELIRTLAEKPVLWSAYTASDLWTDPHISANMLQLHLDPEAVPASRPRVFIDRSAAWIADRFNLSGGPRILDLGCGPGLYASRFHDSGADVTGVDFSPRSLAHARETAEETGRSITYLRGNYLETELPEGIDLVTLIYGDYCALSPEQRNRLLTRIHQVLKPGGHLLMDVFSPAAFDTREEGSEISERLMDGFWAPGDYVGVRKSWLYSDEMVALDRYDIFRPDSRKTVYNWLQYFTRESLRMELAASGFNVIELYSDVAGTPTDPESHTMAVVAGLT